MVDISEHVDERFIHAILDDMDVKKPLDWTDGDRIHVNGDLYGVHKRGKNLVKEFKNARRRGNIPPEASIRHDIANREIFINTDKGRILRPLLILYPGKQDASLRLTPDHLERLESNQMTFRDLLNEGIVEWVDADEEEDLFIAPRPYNLPETVPEGADHAGRPLTHENTTWVNLGEPDANDALLEAKVRLPNGEWATTRFTVPLLYTHENSHVEIDPQLILGVCASLIPYPEHNSTPRHRWHGDGEAVPRFAQFELPHATGHALARPPLPTTLHRSDAGDGNDQLRCPAWRTEFRGCDPQPPWLQHAGCGHHEPSFRRSRTWPVELHSNLQRRTEAIPRWPDRGDRGPWSVRTDRGQGARPPEAYAHLEADGLPIPETALEGGNVLVGKTSPPRFLEETGQGSFLQAQERRESSMVVRHREVGWVDNVFVTESLDSGRLVRAMMRSQKIPEVGDKFASRHGQKGVIGRLVDPEDMPFTRDGTVPDLIINPHAIPSRMTVAHVLEMIAGKVGSLEGRRVDGTAFRGEKESSLRGRDGSQRVQPHRT